MTLNHHDSQLLAALLDLARRDVPATAIRLAARLEREPNDVRAGLARLERGGYVDASRCRLTFAGLVVASAALRMLEAVEPARGSVRAA